MNTSLEPEPFEPGGYREVSRRWPIVLGLAILGLAAAAVYIAAVPQVAPKAPTATAVVDLPAPAEPSGGIVLIPGLVPNLHGQAQAVRSIRVAAIAGRMMHSDLSSQALSKEVAVTVPPNSWLLDIACTDPSASRAATCANDFAVAYLQSRRSTAANIVNGQINSLRREVGSLGRAKAALSTKIAVLPPNSPMRAADEAQLTSDKEQLRSLAQQIGNSTSQLTPAATDGSILTFATPPAKPGSPNRLLALPAGFVAGLLLGVIAAFLLSRRDKRARRGQPPAF
jgi:capsular polysaccharide biosynthesis protein